MAETANSVCKKRGAIYSPDILQYVLDHRPKRDSVSRKSRGGQGVRGRVPAASVVHGAVDKWPGWMGTCETRLAGEEEGELVKYCSKDRVEKR